MPALRLKRVLGEGFPVWELVQTVCRLLLPPKWEYQKAQAVALLWKVSASKARAAVPNLNSPREWMVVGVSR